MSDNSDDALPPDQEEEVTEETPAGPVIQTQPVQIPNPLLQQVPPNPQTAFVTVPMPNQLNQVFNEAMQAGYNAHQNYESEARQRLRAIRDRVTLARLGGLEVTKPKYISASAVGIMAKWLVAQCIGDNLAPDESGLYVRDLIPYHDLLAGPDGLGSNDIRHEDEWITPDPRRFRTGYDDTEMTLYMTNRNSDNDRKVILIYGIHNLDDSTPIHLRRLDFMRGTIKRITLTKIDSLFDLDGFYFFQTPILYKKNDNLRIVGTVGRESIGQTDKIKILGMTGDMLGANYCG